MKKYLLLFCFYFLSIYVVNAQFKYRLFSATLSGGASRGYMDAANGDVNLNLGISGQMNLSPFTYVALDFNNGKFSKNTPDQYFRAFEANYNTATATLNVSMGELVKPWWQDASGIFNNLYVGAGVGIVNSSMKNFNNKAKDGGYTFIGNLKYEGTNVMFPVNIGMNLKFTTYGDETPISVNINYQHGFVLTDNIDGYDPVIDNKFSDNFGIVTIGLRFNFGKEKTYYNFN